MSFGDGGGHRATVSETGLANSQKDTMTMDHAALLEVLEAMKSAVDTEERLPDGIGVREL
jgi:hypothetical protein